MNPAMHAFITTVKKYNIPVHLVDSFLKSMKSDLYNKTYKNTEELNDYIYGTTDVVGLMCLKIFVYGREKLYVELEKPAMKLGSALQKINFIRVLKADVLQLKRNYFPGFDINTFDDSGAKIFKREFKNMFYVCVYTLPLQSMISFLNLSPLSSKSRNIS